MPKLSTLRICCILVCFLTFCGCATLKVQEIKSRPLPSLQKALSEFEKNKLAVSSFAMQGELELFTATEELYGDHLIMGQYPDKIAAHVMGPFGRPVLRLVADSQSIVVLDYRANRLYKGKASPYNLARFLGLDLNPRQIYSVLTGVPVMSSYSKAKLKPGPASHLAIMDFLGKNDLVLERVVFDQTSFKLREQVIKDVSQSDLFECKYLDFKKENGQSYPTKFEIKDAKGRKFVLLNEKTLINTKLNEKTFKIPLFKDLEVVELP